MDTMGYLLIILALMLDIVCGISGQIHLASENNGIQGEQFTFICSMTTLSRTVTFFDPLSRIAGSCIFPEYVCDSGYGYKLSQNVNPLRTFLTIDNLNRTLHQGIWKCVYGKEQARMNLSVITFPNTVLMEEPEIDIDLTVAPPVIINITCSCSCSYPDAVFGLSLVEGKSEYQIESYTFNKQSIDTSYTCEDQLEKPYIGQFSLTVRDDLPLLTSTTTHMKCYVNVSGVRAPMFGMSIVRVTSPKSTETGLSAGTIAGIVIGVLSFFILTPVCIVLIVHCRRDQSPSNIPEEKLSEYDVPIRSKFHVRRTR